ncbi:succinate--hydroxymethylglutarate CoA-transferase isoform X3 [Scyliorhinus torazame]|uniref:succinate--hydroxymethylglutarate CoA-transferase isoform X3 n=1 Tax=Scyliorhinus torazame TaxID=75743 RepID=UPI003B596A46
MLRLAAVRGCRKLSGTGTESQNCYSTEGCHSAHQTIPALCKSNVKPLEGVKILDLTRVLAGPFATMILGDLGAEIIKVERPGAGDDTRAWGPPFVGTESAYFLSVNRNKKSIAVNLKDPCGARIIKDLASVCDVLMENYVPGKLADMGLGYRHIQEVAPHIVYCSITGYGQTGPMSQRAGYDSIVCAVSGLMHITGPQDGDPVRPGVAMTDLATGLYSHGAIMAGLLQKAKTGKGLHIDCNLLSSQVACLTHIAANYLTGRKEAKRWGTAHESIVPYQAFETKDGYLVVGTGNDQQFSVVCKILSLPSLSQEPRFKTNKLRVQNRRELIGILCARFRDKTTQNWLELFEGSGVPYGPINSIQQAFSEPQNSRSSKSGENQQQQKKERKKTAMRTPFFVLNIFIIDFWLRGNADPITPNPPAVNVSLPRSTEGPVTNHAALSWCAKFITWYSLSYIIEGLLALAILSCAVQTMSLHKWKRRAYRARTLVYWIQSPIFGYNQTPDSRDK